MSQLGFLSIQNVSNVLIMFSFSTILTLLLFVVAYILSFDLKKDGEKLSEYECGFDPFDEATRKTFDVQFYIVGILFLIFDVEVALFFPWSGRIQDISLFGFYIMMLFIIILTIGFYYEWHKGALVWHTKIKDFSFLVIADLLNPISNLGSMLTNSFDSLTKITYFVKDVEFYLLSSILGLLILIALTEFSPKANFVEKKNQTLYILKSSIIISYVIYILLTIYILFSYKTVDFNSYMFSNKYGLELKMLLIFSVIVVLILSWDYIRVHTRHLMEYSLLILMATLFLFILLSSFNLITIVFGIMGFSLNVYVLLLSDDRNEGCREAAIKYYYLSSISSGFFGSGLVIVYFIFKDTNYAVIHNILQFWSDTNAPILSSFILKFMLCMIIFGCFFKLSVFPCHLWAPDVYEGSPNPITFFLLVPVKIAVYGFFVRLLTYTFNDLFFIWQYILYVGAIGSLIYGALLAFDEAKLKRFWSYSSINQMSLLILGITTGTIEGVRAAFFFLFIYVITTIVFFIIFLSTKETKTGKMLVYLTDLTYYIKDNRLGSLTLSIILFSMAGIPPLAGFFAKFFLLTHGVESSLYFLVIIILITNLVSTYYYFRIIKIIWFDFNLKKSKSFITILNDFVSIVLIYSLLLLVCAGLVLQPYITHFSEICW